MTHHIRPEDFFRMYPYSKDENGNIIHIDDVKDGDERSFFCIGCDSVMIPRRGQEKIHHFAHKSQQSCNGETVVHFMSKKRFYDMYKRCLLNGTKIPLIFGYSIDGVCPKHRECKSLIPQEKHYDLIEHFPEIELESGHNGFVADIKLFNRETGKIMFIEIANHHRCSKEKRESGIPIIEITIKNFDDIDMIEEIPNTGIKDWKPVEFINIKDPVIKKQSKYLHSCKKMSCSKYRQSIEDSLSHLNSSREKNLDMITKKYQSMEWRAKKQIDTDRQNEVRALNGEYKTKKLNLINSYIKDLDGLGDKAKDELLDTIRDWEYYNEKVFLCPTFTKVSYPHTTPDSP